MLLLLQDFRKIPEHRRLTTKMELIDVIKKAQIVSTQTQHSEFGPFRQGYSDYEPVRAGPCSRTYYSTRPNYAPEASSSRQYHHEYTTQLNNGSENSGSRHGCSTPVLDRQDNIPGYDEVFSPTNTTVSDM